MSFLVQSHQVFFGRPLCVIPSTSHVIQCLTQSLSCFRSTCPNHRNQLFLIIKLTSSSHQGFYIELLSNCWDVSHSTLQSLSATIPVGPSSLPFFIILSAFKISSLLISSQGPSTLSQVVALSHVFSTFSSFAPRAGSGVVRIDQLRFLAGCRTRRLNQA